jgi:hypothetical protein
MKRESEAGIPNSFKKLRLDIAGYILENFRNGG